MIVDRLTDYRSRYGYPAGWALWAEFWWRIEHLGVGRLVGRRVRSYAYARRKGAEHRGYERRAHEPR